MKILTNYLQILTLIMAMDIEFPDVISDFFYPADKVGSPSTPFVSFD